MTQENKSRLFTFLNSEAASRLGDVQFGKLLKEEGYSTLVEQAKEKFGYNEFQREGIQERLKEIESERKELEEEKQALEAELGEYSK